MAAAKALAMSVFAYTAIGKDGRKTNGTLSADTRAAAITEVMKDPEVLQKLKVIGFDPIVKDTAATMDYFRAEIANWGKMVKAVGITVD